MSKKPQETPETEAEKTTDASAVELEEKELGKVAGGAVYVKKDALADAFIDKASVDVKIDETLMDKFTTDVPRR